MHKKSWSAESDENLDKQEVYENLIKNLLQITTHSPSQGRQRFLNNRQAFFVLNCLTELLFRNFNLIYNFFCPNVLLKSLNKKKG